MTKQEKDKIAEKCFLYEKYYAQFQKHLRFNKYDYEDMQISLEKANQIYHKKLAQLNTIAFVLDLMYSSNTFYDMQQRELFSWCIDLMMNRLRYYLERQIEDITKE